MSSKSSAHVVYVSRSGLAMCPACVTHFRLEEPAHTTTQCPFCETTLGVSVKQPRSLQGLSALTRLNRSKSGMMLAALGVSVTLSACEQKSPEVVEPENVPPVVEIKNGGSTSPTAPSSQPVARDMGTQQDMGADMAADSGTRQELAPDSPPASIYGGPPEEGPEFEVIEAPEAPALPKYGLPPSERKPPTIPKK